MDSRQAERIQRLLLAEENANDILHHEVRVLRAEVKRLHEALAKIADFKDEPTAAEYARDILRPVTEDELAARLRKILYDGEG
jgi:cell division protein FtsB